LLPHVIRDVGQLSFIGKNCGNVIWLADKVECAQRFPDLLGGRVDSRDEVSRPDPLPNLSRECAHTASDWGTHFNSVCRVNVPAYLELSDDSALVDAGADNAGIRYLSGIGCDHLGRLQKFNDLGPPGCVSEADQRKRGIATHAEGRIGEHSQQSFMKPGAGCVLSHHPGISVAHFFDRI
jgi:hypothetical protein